VFHCASLTRTIASPLVVRSGPVFRDSKCVLRGTLVHFEGPTRLGILPIAAFLAMPDWGVNFVGGGHECGGFVEPVRGVACGSGLLTLRCGATFRCMSTWPQPHGVHGQCAGVFLGVNDEAVLVLLGKLSELE
jgi:hypothetical protein